MTDQETISVLIICHFFPPESMGGAHRWERLTQHFSEDIECRILRPPPSYPYGEFSRTYQPWQAETIDNTAITRLWTYQPQTDTDIGRILSYGVFSVLASLYVLLNFWRFDSVVTMSTPHTTFLPGAISKLLGRTWITDIFDLWIDNAVDFGYIEEGSLSYRVGRELECVAMRWSDRIVVITPTMADYYAERYAVARAKFAIVPFGVDEKLFNPQATSEIDKRIVYTGNLGTLQTFEPYIRGFAEWVDGANGSAELYLVGTGERKEELHRLVAELGIADKVNFTGQLPRDEIPELLASASVSWVPLDTDHHLDYARPTKLLESMATGTPYIASEVDEIENVTNQSNAGITVPNEAAAVRTALENLLGDEAKRREMGKRGISFIEENHRWDSLADTLEHEIRQAIGGDSTYS